MKKSKTLWSCQECGFQSTKWIGCCTLCQKWNTFAEEKETPSERFEAKDFKKISPQRVCDVVHKESQRYLTSLRDLDRVLGGGLVEGSLILLAGDPGIGKSSLLLQIASLLAQKNLKILYICGEESVEQTSLRAQRFGIHQEQVFLLNETNFSLINEAIDEINPHILMIDSIQIIYKPSIPSAPGSVAQVRELAIEFMHVAKGKKIATFLIGHVTKTGEVAGPKVLEHIVDAVLEFEGDKQHGYRSLRASKNRFGPTDEMAMFQMQPQGLVEVDNPSFLFLQERLQNSPGSVVVPTLEGTRSLLVEIQALVAPCAWSNPSRKSTGLDIHRLTLLLALLEKKVGYQLQNTDIFVSVTGGIKVLEPAADLGILLAVASSFRNLVIPADVLVCGEVGLGGEVRSIYRIENRLKEAIHMGFKKALIPKRNLTSLPLDVSGKIHIKGIEHVQGALDEVFNH